MKNALIALALASFAVVVSTSPAMAFSDLERFAHGAAEGGGGERYFTGSPLDGYACNVCHTGGSDPIISVGGLPLTGFVPGLTYEIKVRWAYPEISHAFHIELVDRGGQNPAVTLVPEDALAPEERCGQVPEEKPAASIVELGSRRIVVVEGCGAAQARFRFTAPELPDVSFAMAGVSSDASATAEGDGTITLTRVLYREGVQPSSVGETCALTTPSASGRLPQAALLLAGSALAWRRTSIGRRRRRRQP